MVQHESTACPFPFRVVSEAELAEWTGNSKRFWQQKRADGSGPPFFKVGGTVRYALPDVIEWLENRRRHSTAEHHAAREEART